MSVLMITLFLELPSYKLKGAIKCQVDNGAAGGGVYFGRNYSTRLKAYTPLFKNKTAKALKNVPRSADLFLVLGCHHEALSRPFNFIWSLRSIFIALDYYEGDFDGRA